MGRDTTKQATETRAMTYPDIHLVQLQARRAEPDPLLRRTYRETRRWP